MDDIESRIRSYILESFLPNADPATLLPSTPLITGGILDSVATVRAVMFLEETFGIEVEAHEVNAENLETVESIASLVRRKRGRTG